MTCEQPDSELRRLFGELGFVALSEPMVGVLRQAAKAACLSDITVLLEGETGTGKQVLANAIHQWDQKRRSRPFVTVHCSTINQTLAESEFFGHQRGAFSGAVTHRKRLFQAAQRGTLPLESGPTAAGGTPAPRLIRAPPRWPALCFHRHSRFVPAILRFRRRSPLPDFLSQRPARRPYSVPVPRGRPAHA